MVAVLCFCFIGGTTPAHADLGDPICRSLDIDFSREDMMTLDEFNLDETIGIESSEYSNVMMFHGYLFPGEETQIAWVQLNSPNYDWNQDGEQEIGVSSDINWIRHSDGPSAGEVMDSYNDWDLIVLPIGTRGDYADSVHDTIDYPEMDEETYQWLQDNVPPPPSACFADLDRDGSVGTSDLLELFAQWGTAGSADFDGSGAVGTSDLLALLANWGPCP